MEKHSRSLLVQGGIVLTMNAEREVLEEGYVAVVDGRIAEVGAGTAAAKWASLPVFDARECVIMPGLVNAHEHLDQVLYRGLVDDMVPAERAEPHMNLAALQTEDRAYRAARQTLLELTRSGVTTTTESYWVQTHPGSMNGVCKAVHEFKMRGVLGRAFRENASGARAVLAESWDDVKKEIIELNDRWADEKICIVPEPISIINTSRETAQDVERFARQNGTVWFTHIATGDIRTILHNTGRGLTHFLEDMGVLKDNLVAAHCNVLYPGEPERMARAGMRLAHAPMAQLWQGSPVADLMAILAAGGKVGLGVDGAWTNNSQSMWESMKMCVYAQQQRYQNQMVADAYLALELATIRSAETLNLSDQIGSLEPGKHADLCILDGYYPGLRPLPALLINMVYSGSDEAVSAVIMGGEVVMSARKHLLFDEREIITAAEEAQREMLDESGVGEQYRAQRRWIM